MERPKLLFVYESKFAVEVRDGLWGALELLRQDFDIHKINLAFDKPHSVECDFILGWGAFNSRADRLIQAIETDIPKGLCLGGMGGLSEGVMPNYKVLFYETEWAREWLNQVGFAQRFSPHAKFIHAFGVNTDIFWKQPGTPKIFDWLSVGSFSTWKRHHLITKKNGVRLVIGEIQQDNLSESLDILSNLVINGVGIMDMVDTETLGRIYNASKNVYIPGNLLDGGERAVLEARACNVSVEVEDDNPKLKSLLDVRVWDHHYYRDQLYKGIMGCLEANK